VFVVRIRVFSPTRFITPCHDGLPRHRAGRHAAAAEDAAAVELRAHLLIRAQPEVAAGERLRPQGDRELVAVDVAAAVVDRVADLDQRLLDRAALERRDEDLAAPVDLDELADGLVPENVLERVRVRRGELETVVAAPVRRDALDPQHPVARDPVAISARTLRGTGTQERSWRISSILSARIPIAAAFQIETGVIRYVCR
jgi:hypothetical protein